MTNRTKLTKKLLNIIYIFFVLSCFVYGVSSITYANTNSDSVNLEISINQDGGHTTTGNLFSPGLWYPGYEENGIIRIKNNFKKASIKDLGLNVDLISCQSGFNADEVYNSFINNMRLTIKKGTLLSFNRTIVEDKSLADLLRNGIGFSTADTVMIGNSIDFKYTLKMDEKATDELESMRARVGFTFNAEEIPNGGGGNGGGNGGYNKPTPPPKPSGDLIDRMPGHIPLNEMKKIDEQKEEIIIPFNVDLLRANDDHTPRIYYWNEFVQKWVALASYVVTPYTVKAINDGGYTGWFKVFGVIQPNFNDLILSHWAEPVTNRMNGLGIIEGYPGDGLIRPAQLEQPITRTEFTTLIFRLLNINPDKQILENIELNDARKILNECYGDAEDIPDWVAGVVAATTKAGLVETREGKFLANEPITELEAAVMISKALKLLEKFQPIDLDQFKEPNGLPDWAKASLTEGISIGSPDNTFKLKEFITRAEALTVLKLLFVNGMGL